MLKHTLKNQHAEFYCQIVVICLHTNIWNTFGEQNQYDVLLGWNSNLGGEGREDRSTVPKGSIYLEILLLESFLETFGYDNLKIQLQAIKTFKNAKHMEIATFLNLKRQKIR